MTSSLLCSSLKKLQYHRSCRTGCIYKAVISWDWCIFYYYGYKYNQALIEFHNNLDSSGEVYNDFQAAEQLLIQ